MVDMMPDALHHFQRQVQASQSRVAELAARARYGDDGSEDFQEQVLTEMFTTLEELRVAEEELRQQNDELLEFHLALDALRGRYQDLFELAPDGYFVSDGLGVIREANLAAARLLEMDARRLVGKPLAAFIVPSEVRAFRQYLVEAQQSAGTTQWETRLHPRVGADIPVSIKVATPSPHPDRPALLRWLVRDISEQQRAQAQQEQLARAEAAHAEAEAARERLHAILESIGDGFFTLDRGSRFTYVNRQEETLWGRARETLLGRNIWEMFPQAVGTQVYQHLCRALRERDQAVASFETLSPVLGTWIEVNVCLTPEGISVSFRDISVRKEGEQRLQMAYQRERRIAEALQRSLLRTVPVDAFPGLVVATFYEAALAEAQVGGDFFDVFTFDSGKVALVVGDVSGKGLAAAACTAEVKYALRAFLRQDMRPDVALSHLNDFLCDAREQSDWGSEIFVVLALAVIDPDTGDAQFCLAGSEPLLLLRADGRVEIVDAKGMLLGIQPGMPYAQTMRQMEPGDAILITTDGITEAHQSNEFLGFDGLRQMVQQLAAAQPDVETLGRDILQNARAFAGGALHDDACLLIAQRR